MRNAGLPARRAPWPAVVVAFLAGATAAAQNSGVTSSAADASSAAPTAGPSRGGAPAAVSAATDAGEFIYRTRAGDTLIGLAARLLREPQRWRALQLRNRIAEPRRMPLGSAIRIPYDWLRVTRQSARVVERVGTVTLDGRPLADGTAIDPGATLETAANASVTLELADGSIVVLKPSSLLRVERLQRIDGAGADEASLQLERGKLETQVKPRGELGRFEIRTPAAVSAVRGTEFRASFAEASATATTETLDGAVAISGVGSGIGAGASVEVRGGFGTSTERGQSPREPVPLLPAPKLDGLAPRNDRATLRWQFEPVPGATAYRHQLSRDSQFRALVSDAVTTTPSSRVDDLPDGHYWLRVRAIDTVAIEGFDATVELEQRRRLEAPTPTEPAAGARRGSASTRFAWTALPGATHYRFQLAREADFVATLIDRDIGNAELAAAGDPGTDVAGLQAGRYWWRLSAVDSAGVAGHWSAPLPFDQKAAPVTPAAVPEARAHDARTQTFRWTATDSGQQFEWQLAADPLFRRVLREGRSAAAELRLEALPVGHHYLRVRTLDADGFESAFGPATRVAVPVPAWVWFVVPAIVLIPVL